MKRILSFALSLCVTAFAGTLAAQEKAPDDWRARWAALQERAKGQSLVISVHSQDGYAATVRAFQRKFPGIKVAITEIIPDAMVTRVLNEQRNNMFAWDVMWASTTNMNALLIPAGAFQDLEPLLLLPEVTDKNQWHATDYQWTTPKAKQVFIHALFKTVLAHQNMDNSKGVKVTSLDQLLDPSFKGKIGIRDPYHANGGTWMFGSFYQKKGPEFMRQFYAQMDLVVNMNPRQAADALIRGDMALALGTTSDVISRCKKSGGCKNIAPLPFGGLIGSRGVAVFKNAPNAAAATLFVNWLLSKEGQEAFVAEFAKLNESDAVSRRKDVSPPANTLHQDSVPEWANLPNEYIPGIDAGNVALEAAMKLYVDVKGRAR